MTLFKRLRATTSAKDRMRVRPRLELLEGRSLLSAGGSFVSTFGNGGSVVTNYGDGLAAMTTQPDGKILFVTNQSLVRLNANGSVDTTFGTNGVVTNSAINAQNSVILVLPNGNIDVASNLISSASPGGGPTYQGTQILQFTPNGTLDTTFGTGGIVSEDLFPISDMAAEGNQILFTGSINGLFAAPVPPGQVTPTVTTNFQVARLNADGSTDTTFATNGVATESFNGTSPAASQLVAVTPSGMIAVQGTYPGGGHGAALVQFAPDGTEFSVAAPFTGASLPIQSSEQVLQPNGDLDIISSDTTSVFVLQYLPGGHLDPNFGVGGRMNLPAIANPSLNTTVVSLPNALNISYSATDNTLVVAGASTTGNQSGTYVAKLQPESTFTPYTFTGLTVQAPAGRAFTHPVATITVAAGSTLTNIGPAGIKAVIAWGDGATNAATFEPFRGQYAVEGTHRYARRGVYHTTVYIINAVGDVLNETTGTIYAGF